MQGMVSLAARSASRTTSSTVRRSTPGIEATGARRPSATNSGQIRSSVVSTFSRTMRRAHSVRRLRRSRVVRSSDGAASALASAGTTRTRDSIGRPYLMAMRILPVVRLTRTSGYSVCGPVTMTVRLSVMDFDLTEDQRAFQATARQFARDEMAPNARDLGRERDVSGRCAAQGCGAGLRRHLRERRRRRLGAVAARRHHHLRGAGAGLHLDRGLHLDPQHGGLDDRRLRRRQAAPEIPAEALHHGALRQLLPDRAGFRLRCGEPQDQGGARRRSLRAQRIESLHLRRRRLRHLCLHGAHRRRRARRAFPASSWRRARRDCRSARRRRSSAGNRSRPRW